MRPIHGQGALALICALGSAAPASAAPSTTTTATATPAAAGSLEDDLAKQLADIEAQKRAQGAQSPPPAMPTAAASGAGGTGDASSRGLNTAFNPAISANGLFTAGAASHVGGGEGPLRSGIQVQEIELAASAIVDPYFRADVILTGDAHGFAVEEAYLTTLELPRINIRAGELKAALGRHNLLHTHAFPFLTAPLPWRALLGADGLADAGVSADVLLPLPFFAEVNLQAFQGADWGPLKAPEAPERARRDEDLAYLGHLKTLYELSDATTVELGGTYAGGRNVYAGWTNLLAADLTVKWRPVETERVMGLEWTTEALYVDREEAPRDRRRGGAYSALRYQFAARWWLQARAALLGMPRGDSERRMRYEGLLAFIPSEFSALRLQYAFERPFGAEAVGPDVHEIFLQTVFSIGSHPAHAY